VPQSESAGNGAAAVGSVAGIGGAIRRGEKTAVEMLSAHMARHAATHAAINGLVQQRHEAAAAEAASIDRSRANGGGDLGPLAGVPLSVKECFPVAGLRTTLGIESRLDRGDNGTAAIVSRLQAAGGLIVGKANVPQAMYLHETDNPVWGRTNHPENPQRGPGGSSGGDAALVAAGVVAAGVGTDLAGSIRQPAHACGIAGILPRSAVLGEGGSFDTMPHLAVVRPRAGFLARRVDDLALLLEAATGQNWPRQIGRRLEPPQRPLRIGWWDETGPIPASPAVRRGVAEAMTALRMAGVEDQQLDSAIGVDAAWLLLGLLSADGGADIRGLFEGSEPMPAVGRLLAMAGMPRSLRPLVAAVAACAGRRLEAQALRATGPRHGSALNHLLVNRQQLADHIEGLSTRLDAIVCPVSAVPALRHGTASKLILAAVPCLLANLLDLAAGAVPVTRVAEGEESRGPDRDPVINSGREADRDSLGLPIGVQVIALRGGEATVLDVMGVIEAGCRFSHRAAG